ncbi:MAG: hypothetical protein WBR26_07270, partial [Candidatus Acidiferrum sp.]
TGEHTKRERTALFSRYVTGVPAAGQHSRKKRLQRPTSLEIPDKPDGMRRPVSLAGCDTLPMFDVLEAQ